MKRIIAATVLLIITITVNYIGKVQVENLCEKTINILDDIKLKINEDPKNCLSKYYSIPEIEKITPYIYNNEIVDVEDKLVELKSYLTENDSKNAKIAIDKCIFLLKKIQDKEKLSISSFL